MSARASRSSPNGYKSAIDSMRGQLLIAGATLPDPNFARTVVLICEHSEEGALGLVLNRPGELVVGAAAPELAGIPFFYWYQFAWVVVAAVLTAIVYLATRRP